MQAAKKRGKAGAIKEEWEFKYDTGVLRKHFPPKEKPKTTKQDYWKVSSVKNIFLTAELFSRWTNVVTAMWKFNLWHDRQRN